MAGHKVYRNINLLATGQLIKGGYGRLTGWHFVNQAAAARYVKLYDKATAPTVGTDTPKMTVALAATSQRDFPIDDDGVEFLLGIGIGATTGIADADTGAPTANDVVVNVFYK